MTRKEGMHTLATRHPAAAAALPARVPPPCKLGRPQQNACPHHQAGKGPPECHRPSSKAAADGVGSSLVCLVQRETATSDASSKHHHQTVSGWRHGHSAPTPKAARGAAVPSHQLGCCV